MNQTKQADDDEWPPCFDCGGTVKVEVDGNFRDWRCQNCGIIVAGGELVAEANEVSEQKYGSNQTDE